MSLQTDDVTTVNNYFYSITRSLKLRRCYYYTVKSFSIRPYSSTLHFHRMTYIYYLNFQTNHGFTVFLLFRCFLLIVDVFPSVLVCNPDLFSFNRFLTFEQRYTTVAFMYKTSSTTMLTCI